MSQAQKSCPRSCLRVFRICSKIHVFAFHFSGSLWVSPIVWDNVSSLMHPYCLIQWLSLEGNMKILIPVNLPAKADAPSVTVRSRGECLGMRQREICKSRQSQKKTLSQEIFQARTWKSEGRGSNVNAGPVYMAGTGQSLCFEASVSLEMWGAVAVL